MNYEELVENAKVCCGDIEVEDCVERCKNPCDKRGEEVRWCRQWLIHDLHTAITDLLTHIESVEADRDRLREAMKPNCLMCDSMHENGNCTVVGGFCTAVPAAHCPLIPELIARAEAAEEQLARYKKSGLEPCDYAAIKSGLANEEKAKKDLNDAIHALEEQAKRAEASERRAEKAEKCIAEIKSARAHTRPAYVVDQILKKWSGEGE